MIKITYSSLKTIVKDIKEKIDNNRISNITLVNSRDILLSFSTFREEKLLVSLNHQLPFLCFVKVEDSIPTITGGLSDIFRKELKEGIVKDIVLLNDDRIIDFSFIKTNDYFEKEEKHLIIELIPYRPNILLLDDDNKIIYAAHYSNITSAHPIIKGMTYVPIIKGNSFKSDEETISLKEIKAFANEYLYEAKRKRINEKYEYLFKHLKNRIKSDNQKLKILDKEIETAKEKLIYQEYGNALLAFAYDNESLAQYIKDNNFPYDDSLTVGVNADRIFKKYKKAKRTIEINQLEKEKAIKEIERFTVILHQTSYMNEDDLYDLAKELLPSKFSERAKKEKALAKISYVTIDNTKIYFGKNAHQNEEITFKIAKKDDYYFHIKDYHGAHVVIANSNPNKEMLLVASELCLLLSNQSSGDIMYTPIKNVKKGQSNGEARLTTYKIITLKEIRESTIALLKNHH